MTEVSLLLLNASVLTYVLVTIKKTSSNTRAKSSSVTLQHPTKMPATFTLLKY